MWVYGQKVIVGSTSTPRPRFISKIQTNCQYNKSLLITDRILYYNVRLQCFDQWFWSCALLTLTWWVGKTALVLPISFEFGANRYQIHVYHLHYSLLSYENYFQWLIQCQQKAIWHFYWLTDMVHTRLPRAQRVITDALVYMMARAHDVKCRVLGQSPRDENFELC